MKRLFMAIGISKQLQEKIFEWREGYANLPVRWLSGKNLHITLVPPWSERDIEKVKATLTALSGKFGLFELRFDRVCYGPDPRRPRLIWAEGEASSQIVDLKSQIGDALRMRAEQRPFQLHLTLARFREDDFKDFPVKKIDDKVDWQDEVKTFVLMESHLSPRGADYEALAEFNL